MKKKCIIQQNFVFLLFLGNIGEIEAFIRVQQIL